MSATKHTLGLSFELAYGMGSSFFERWPLPRRMHDIQDSHLRFHDVTYDHIAAVDDQLEGVGHPPAPAHS